MDNVNKQDTREQELQNVTEQGTPPRRRIATYAAARELFKRLRLADDKDAVRRATIQGMIDGNPPYDQKELEELGLGDITNVNFMSMRASLDARAAAAHELFVEVPTLVEASPIAAAPDPQAYHSCQVVSEELSRMILDWPHFLSSADLFVRESDAYGIGPILWPDEWDWRFKAYRRSSMLFDPKAVVEVDNNDLYMIRDEMRAGDLYRTIEDPEIARSRGWKIDRIKEALIRLYLGKESNTIDPLDTHGSSPWESLQHRMRNNDPDLQARDFEPVRIVHILVREVSGDRKISHLIITEGETASDGFLCELHDQFESMDQCLWWLPFNYGDGYARSVRGVASHMVQHDDLSNRFLGRLFDAGFMSSSLLLQPTTNQDLDRLQFMRHGPYTIIPPELKAIQSTFQPQIMPLVQLRGISESVMQNNTGGFRPHSEMIDREAPKTARQVVEEVSKEARYEKAAVAHRYNCLDKLYREVFRRVASKEVHDSEIKFPGKEEAQRFFKRCEARGVDRRFIMDWRENLMIHATRAIGLGSLGVKYDITNQLMGARGAFDEAGNRQVIQDWTAARVGYRNAAKYVAPVDRNKIPSNEHSIAMLENNDIGEGQQVLAASDQMQTIHLQVHGMAAAQLVEGVQTGQIQDPQQAFTALQGYYQHLSQHVELLSRDEVRKGLADPVIELLKQIEEAIRMLEQYLKKMQQEQMRAQEEQQGKLAEADKVLADRELEAKIYEINQKSQLDAMKQQSLNDMRKSKTDEQMSIQRDRMTADTRLKAERQAAEIEIARLRAQADTAIKAANQ